MSVAILRSRAQIGTTAPPVTIEVFLSGGLPAFSVVGMPETAVRESKDRVRGALLSSEFRFPLERIIVSLGPADMRKSGGRFDLAIALGILVASKQVPAALLDSFEFYGELALNGALRPVPGVLCAALKADADARNIIVPRENAAEAALVSERVHAAGSLLDVCAHFRRVQAITPALRVEPEPAAAEVPDIADVRGQRHAKYALEVAAAGGHNLLFVGPPGTGKSMLAARLPGILPPMSKEEALETAAIDSVLGMPFNAKRWRLRPFRAPHHTASAPALVGGGSDPRPGEVSRAHNGVLFLDELPEFSRHVLEVLREPLESGQITISRARRQNDFPAAFQLVAAMNPCPCGYLGDLRGDCACSAERVRAYRSRISGPLLDRIDLQVEVGRPAPELLRGPSPAAETSREVQQRVAAAHALQLHRQGTSNARLAGKLLARHCELDVRGWQMLDDAADKFALSVRSYQRILRVSRTIADLAGTAAIRADQLAAALAMRGLAVTKPGQGDAR
ncbi:MAG TPA: YifB family Mg chelatase-like AAA ATPase [Woeseiaceae bacterium]|nr:YifB family Mg chelatase-like AAA ATPase [Woeseiaceae bacterium]